jgi:hypothetical protein
VKSSVIARGLAASLVIAGALVAQTRSIPVAGDLGDVTVMRHFFSTGIRGSGRYVGVKDPAKGRMLLLVVSAKVPPEMKTFHAVDWVLVYRHSGGAADRANCDGIAIAEKQGASIGTFHLGDTARVQAPSGTAHFAVAFLVEPDVREVELYRIGVPTPIIYNVGSERQYSIFITTNAETDVMDRGRNSIVRGGYNVVEVSHGLNKDTRGVHILYQKNAETPAREISSA